MTRSFNREISKRYKAKADHGFILPLPDTTRVVLGLPRTAEVPEDQLLVARVRKLTLAGLATMTGLSSEMQDAVMQVFRETERIAGVDDDEDEAYVDPWETFKGNVEQQRILVYGCARLGFVSPRVVETQEEADALGDPDVVCQDEIEYHDLEDFYVTVMRPESEAAKALAPFPDDRMESSAVGAPVPISTKAKRGSKASPGVPA